MSRRLSAPRIPDLGAKAKDILALMEVIKKKVKSRTGIDLEPEIKIWG